MKKVVFIFVSFIFLVSSYDAYECKNVVDINIFHGDGCPHCANALSYFDELKDKYGECISINKYEVWNDKDNLLLMKEVTSYLDEDVSGVPYIVIGNESIEGYSAAFNENIESIIDNCIDTSNCVNVVSEINDQNDIIINSIDAEIDDEDEKIVVSVDDDSNDNFIDFMKKNISYISFFVSLLALIVSIINYIKLNKNN